MKVSPKNLQNIISRPKTIIEEAINAYLDELEPSELTKAMKYSVLSGGKRIRSVLSLLCYEAIKEKPVLDKDADILGICVAIELLHTMSLIHDDLPSMDNDDYRRGKLTNHKVFGEGMAILAGDALLVMAGDVMIRHLDKACVNPAIIIHILKKFNAAIGLSGMIAGQALDISASLNNSVNPSLKQIHCLKTAAFFGFATYASVYLAGESDTTALRFQEFGENLGLAFQISDDLLDQTQSLDQLGKSPGKDQLNDKLTYVTLYGREKTEIELSDIYNKCLNLIDHNKFMEPLKTVLDMVVNRKS